MKRSYNCPSVNFMMFNTEDVMTASSGDNVFSPDHIYDGGDWL